MKLKDASVKYLTVLSQKEEKVWPLSKKNGSQGYKCKHATNRLQLLHSCYIYLQEWAALNKNHDMLQFSFLFILIVLGFF